MRFPIGALVFLFCFVNGFGEEASLKSAKAAYQKADALLDEVYRKAKSAFSEYEFAELRKEQLDWLEYRENRSNSAAVYDGGVPEGKEQTSVDYWETAEAITATRTRIINGLINPDTITDKVWEGSWEDGEGGILDISENEDGSIVFLAQCVRGPTYHTGSISGTAPTNGNQARFTEASEVEGEGEIWLTFIREGARLELFGQNTSHYHGMRAYFDGTYVRVAKLDSDKFKKEFEQYHGN